MSVQRAPFEVLDAYQSGEMPEAEASLFEEELFASAAIGAAHEANFVDRVALIGRYLAPRGGLDMGSSRARIDELRAAGLRVQFVSPELGPVVRMPAIDDDAEIVVTHVPVDVRGYDSVDVTVEKPDGTELKTFREVGWDPIDGTLYAVCEAPLARISARQRQTRVRIIGSRGGEKHSIAVFETRAD